MDRGRNNYDIVVKTVYWNKKYSMQICFQQSHTWNSERSKSDTAHLLSLASITTHKHRFCDSASELGSK